MWFSSLFLRLTKFVQLQEQFNYHCGAHLKYPFSLTFEHQINAKAFYFEHQMN